MKISLSVSDECEQELRTLLTGFGIEISDDAEFILLQKDKYPGHINSRDEEGEKAVISVDDIITIESYGHTVELHTMNGVFKTSVAEAVAEVLIPLQKRKTQFLSDKGYIENVLKNGAEKALDKAEKKIKLCS